MLDRVKTKGFSFQVSAGFSSLICIDSFYLCTFFPFCILAAVGLQVLKKKKKRTKAMKKFTRFKTHSLREWLNETGVLKMVCNLFLAHGFLNLICSHITSGRSYQLCVILFVCTAFTTSHSISMLLNHDHHAGIIFTKVWVALNHYGSDAKRVVYYFFEI